MKMFMFVLGIVLVAQVSDAQACGSVSTKNGTVTVQTYNAVGNVMISGDAADEMIRLLSSSVVPQGGDNEIKVYSGRNVTCFVYPERLGTRRMCGFALDGQGNADAQLAPMPKPGVSVGNSGCSQ